jgi:hypothetical protein
MRAPVQARIVKFRQRFSVRLVALRLLTLTGLTGMCLAQEPNSQAFRETAPSHLVAYISVAAAIGTVITVAIGIAQAVAAWTASGRKNRALMRATQLAALIEATVKMAPSQIDAPFLLELRESAEREFIQAAGRCYPAKQLPSKVRQLFLIYLPPRMLAYIPHFLFFSLCSLAVIAVFEIGDSILDRTAGADDLMVFFLIACLICFMQRWAALELRKRNNVVLQRKHLRCGINWYPANSYWGLLSNALLITCLAGLPLNFLSGGSAVSHTMVSVWPHWQRLVMTLVGCTLIPTYYLWSRAESLHPSRTTKPLSPSYIARRAVDFRFPECLVGTLAFCLLTLWCFVLLFDLRFVPRIASFPNGTAGRFGFAGGCTIILSGLLFDGVFPWIAVYRGLRDLLDHGRAAPQEVRHDGN